MVYKEPNLKDIVLAKVGSEVFNQFDQLTDFYMGRGDLFITENTSLVIYLYHRIRNVSLKYVLTKLYNVYIKMKPIFSKTSTDPVYNTSVTNLTKLMSAQWDEQVSLSEENAYDFDFLITILMYWKKAKDNPARPATQESETLNLANKADLKKVDETNDDQSNKVVPDEVRPPSDATAFDNESGTSLNSVKEVSIQEPNNEKSESEIGKEAKDLEIRKDKIDSTLLVKQSPGIEVPIIAMKATHHVPTSQVSVLSLHQLKTFLDKNSEPRQRVMKGVGQQAYKEFNNLVTSLQDMSMVIGDINVKTLYFTIINFANHPVTSEMKKFEPLSNFSLKCEPFQDLKNLMLKDVNVRGIVTNQLGSEVVDRFLQLADTLALSRSDFVLNDQESIIVMYHMFRNCVVDNLMTRLKVVHSKIQVVELTNPPSGYTIGVKMLESLMTTHYNGQVLMMEKSKFDFDFLNRILEVLQQCKLSEEVQDTSVAKPIEKKNPLAPIIGSILIDLADIGLMQSLDIMIGSDVCKEYIEVVKALENKTEDLLLQEMKAVFSLKNAIFFFKNNLHCQDVPLTNLCLETEKFSHLLKFIGRDAGIRKAINEKYGEVALKELEALVTAHEERSDKFISKFVEKNVKLYHSLRNTALEKILRQICVVHGKVKNIDLPEAAKTSPQYHIAIKRLDKIVDADFNNKILIIEDLEFEFDFLSTILLVWRTETSKQVEAVEDAKNVAAAAATDPVEVLSIKTETMPTVVINPLTQSSMLNTKTSSDGRKLRSRSSTSRVQQMFQVDDNPDDPEPVTIDDYNVLDPDSIEIIVEDELAPQLQLPEKLHNISTVYRSSPVTSIATVSQLTPVSSSVSPDSCQELLVLDTSPEAEVVPIPRSTPLCIATPTNPMPVPPGWGGEMPVKTKCSECPDKTSETIEQLIHHYSFMHCRDQIEKKYIGQGDSCLLCSEEFKLKFNLIKHLGLVHSAVKINISQSQRWICHFCKKEFLGDEFLRRHLIKLHLEKKFESIFLASSKTNEILCQFCEKKFSYKSNLFCHIGVDHNKLPEILPNYNRNDFVDDLKCRHCDYEGTLASIKTHYLTTHYRDSFASMCREEGLISPDLSCRYCQVIFSDQETLVLHIGADHNRIYRFISHFQGKNIDIVSNSSSTLNAIAVKMPENNQDQEEFLVADIPDPLSTETVFIDTDQDIPLESPVKPQIKIVSPTKLLRKNELKSSNIVSSQNASNNNSAKVNQNKKTQQSSPKSDSKLKRQETSKWCKRCNKNFLASKYDAHVILKHLNKVAESELKRDQALMSCTGLQCPNKSCVKSTKFVNIESLLVHFVTKHTSLLKSELGRESKNLVENNRNKPNKSSDAEICLDISDDGEDIEKTKEAQSQDNKRDISSPWIEKFRTFCKISSLPEAKTMLNNKMETMCPIVLEKFLNHLCQTPSIIPQLEEVTGALASIFPKENIKTLPPVVRHLLLQDYQKHCSVVGTSMQACNPMQVVIMLSQQLAKPGVKPADLEWMVRWVSKMHDKVDGKLLIENKKVIEFFEAVGLKLQEAVETLQVKEEQGENPAYPCDKCGTRFNKKVGLERHMERCGKIENVSKQEHAANSVQKVKGEEKNKKEDDTKQVAASFKAKRSSLGLGQKQVLAHMKSLLGPDLKVQAIDVAKFEMNHSEQAMVKFLPVAQAWLKKLANQETTQTTVMEDVAKVQVKKEPTEPATGQSSSSTMGSSNTSSKTTSIRVDSCVSKVDIVKLKLSPNDLKSPTALASDSAQGSMKMEKVEDQVDDTAETEPECIDLDEEEIVYRYFCHECEGCVGSTTCDHTSHPRVPLQFDISTHIARTGHVAVSPISGLLSLSPITDLAYSFQHGADVRKQWKDLVLAGSYIPSQFTGIKRCKWTGCEEIFEDAVEAFKHIRDIHLKPKQPKVSAAQVSKAPVQPQSGNGASKRKAFSASDSSSDIPLRKIGRGETKY